MNKLEDLIEIKKNLIIKVTQKLENIKISSNGNALENLADKFGALANDYVPIGNEIATEFVEILNSKEFEDIDIKAKEELNNEFRIELKEILISFPKNFLSKK